MPAMYEIKYLPSGETKKFAGSRGNYYELDNGTHIDKQTIPVWCHQCRTITHGEEVEPVDQIDKQLADLIDPRV